MSNVYFTSDTHYGHSNIASPHTSKWKGGYRDYKSLEEMNQDLVKNINKVVKPEDTLWHLGDWSFGGIENIWKFRKQILCDNIHLILGNHDHHIEENKELNIPEEDREYCFHRFGGFATIPAKQLFKSVQHYKELSLNGRIFVLSHYAHRVWHGSHKGWIHLYAHSHDSLPPYGKSKDVGVDTAIRETGLARPFATGEIINFMENQPMEFPDHHDLSTATGKPQFAKRRK
jgi:calcineurin-like phosphoesterase family protein